MSEQMERPLCYCGHDCSRCVTYLATVRRDETLRQQAQRFYRERFGREIPLERISCLGGRSEAVFELCRECPWRACCAERGISSCEECRDYPCEALSAYAAQYVNRCHQIEQE